MGNFRDNETPHKPTPLETSARWVWLCQKQCQGLSRRGEGEPEAFYRSSLGGLVKAAYVMVLCFFLNLGILFTAGTIHGYGT
jgi:hypothetical protein